MHFLHTYLMCINLQRWLLLVPFLIYMGSAVATVPKHSQPTTKAAKRSTLPAIQPCIGFPIPVDTLSGAPTPLRVAYINAQAARTENRQASILSFIKQSEINALIIDVKDCSGRVSFATGDPEIESIRIDPACCKNFKHFIDQLHENGIYTIARIAVFQDPVYAKRYPTEAIKSQKGGIWFDARGLPYIDPASEQFWKYIARLAKACKTVGFDEVNFDYIRFPTDGKLQDMVFPYAVSKMEALPKKQMIYFYNPIDHRNKGDTATSFQQQKRGIQVAISPKTKVITTFYQFLDQEVRKKMGIFTSADLFGMVLTAKTDLNIGQVFEMAVPYFDYIGPMIYPSHYPKGFNNLAQPATQPYEVVLHVLQEGVRRLKAIGQSPHKLRPWLQDFHLGARYDADKLHAQKKGVYDAGLYSWFVWNPSSKYILEKYPSKASSSS